MFGSYGLIQIPTSLKVWITKFWIIINENSCTIDLFYTMPTILSWNQSRLFRLHIISRNTATRKSSRKLFYMTITTFESPRPFLVFKLPHRRAFYWTVRGLWLWLSWIQRIAKLLQLVNTKISIINIRSFRRNKTFLGNKHECSKQSS